MYYKEKLLKYRKIVEDIIRDDEIMHSLDINTLLKIIETDLMISKELESQT